MNKLQKVYAKIEKFKERILEKASIRLHLIAADKPVKMPGKPLMQNSS